jgi:hypothetical protein
VSVRFSSKSRLLPNGKNWQTSPDRSSPSRPSHRRPRTNSGHEIEGQCDQRCLSDVQGHESAMHLIAGEVPEDEGHLLALYGLRHRHFFANSRRPSLKWRHDRRRSSQDSGFPRGAIHNQTCMAAQARTSR